MKLMARPTFIGIGAMRAGSTSLFYSLSCHPQIYTLPYKEIDFFRQDDDGVLPSWVDPEVARRAPHTIDEYLDLFAGAGPQHLAVGEFSPNYFSASVAPRIKAGLPHTKLIVILRDPVDQARSILARWLCRPPTMDELMTWLADMQRRGPRGEPPLYTHGRYIEPLKAYFRLFGRDQIKVVLFEDLVANAQSVLCQIQTFLGVDPINLPLLHLNAVSRPRSRVLAAVTGRRAKTIARSVIPCSLKRRLVPYLHHLQTANTMVSQGMDPTVRQQLFDEYYAASTQQLAMLFPGLLRPWLGEENKRRFVA